MTDLTQEELKAIRRMFVLWAESNFQNKTLCNTLSSAYLKITGKILREEWEELQHARESIFGKPKNPYLK